LIAHIPIPTQKPKPKDPKKDTERACQEANARLERVRQDYKEGDFEREEWEFD
jgi:hypothetical protein